MTENKLSPQRDRAFTRRIVRGGGISIALLFLGLAAFEADQNLKFGGEVEHITGQVERLYTTSSSKGGTSWMIDYNYSTPIAVYHQRRGMSPAAWRLLQTGGPVPIKYLKDVPGDSRIDLPSEDAGYEEAPWILGSIGLGMLILTRFLIRKFRREPIAPPEP